ncbi:glycoside hydrolase [Haematococcus lacustris]
MQLAPVCLLLFFSSVCCCFSGVTASTTGLRQQLKDLWADESHPNATHVQQLRQEAWQMFDFGYQSYLRHAFPKDNLLPISCSGRNWQGGIGVTLIDSLDTLMVMNRKWDIAHAVELINEQISFDKDAKVHVFEVVIRVLGGLLSGHVLLERQPQPSGRTPYDGSLLRHARDLAMRLLPAFNTSSGLPALFINLRKGLDPSEGSVTCTACAGTLLLELGLLTALTGEPQWRRLAEHAAKAMFDRRSRLGLVGSSVDTGSSTWVSKEATIGPGTDSYFEYLLKAYLMNGDVEQLHAFTDLYTSTMRHQQVPGTLQGFSFLADVHMDSGRLAKPYVSSLGAFWPGMQALIGQEQDAKDLHGNFTAAWRTFGWLPEVFGLDLTKVHPDDAGYNLRPEHVESTYMLHATSGDPHYLKLARRLQKTLVRSSTTRCGYAQIANVETGAQTDLMESFFLAETLKYLYLTFTPGGQHMVEYYLLSTEGHLLPVLHPDGPQAELREQQLLQQLMASPSPSDKEPPAHPSAEGTCSLGLSTAAGVAGPASSTRTGLPANCMDICRVPSPGRQSAIEAQLRSSFPLISFNAEDAAVLRRRRCVACIIVSRRMLSTPRMTQAEVWERVGQLNALSTPPGQSAAARPQLSWPRCCAC